MSSLTDILDQRFPGHLTQEAFLRRSFEALRPHGFTAENAIACVGGCRDELCRPLSSAVRDVWGEAFNFASLGGMLTLGQTGFGAAHANAPIEEGRKRFVYIVMAHIGITEDGELGKSLRTGHEGISQACGALAALLQTIRKGDLSLELDLDDIEFSLLKRHVVPHLSAEATSDIASLTIAIAELIHSELERMNALTVDTENSDYAVLSGVQIHLPVEGSVFWVKHKYACIRGARHELDC